MGHTVALAEVERRHILRALRMHDGNRTHAAKALDISLRCLRNKLRGYKECGHRVPEIGQPAHFKNERCRDLLGINYV